jgi:hypothetical protein
MDVTLVLHLVRTHASIIAGSAPNAGRTSTGIPSDSTCCPRKRSGSSSTSSLSAIYRRKLREPQGCSCVSRCWSGSRRSQRELIGQCTRGDSRFCRGYMSRKLGVEQRVDAQRFGPRSRFSCSVDVPGRDSECSLACSLSVGEAGRYSGSMRASKGSADT